MGGHRGRTLRTEFEFSTGTNSTEKGQNANTNLTASHVGRHPRQFSTRSRAKSTASFKGLHRNSQTHETVGSSNLSGGNTGSDQQESTRYGSFKKSKSSDFIARKRTVSGLSMTALNRTRTHYSGEPHGKSSPTTHLRTAHSVTSTGLNCSTTPVGLKPRRTKSTHSIVYMKYSEEDGDNNSNNPSITDEEVEYFTEEEEDSKERTHSKKHDVIKRPITPKKTHSEPPVGINELEQKAQLDSQKLSYKAPSDLLNPSKTSEENTNNIKTTVAAFNENAGNESNDKIEPNLQKNINKSENETEAKQAITDEINGEKLKWTEERNKKNDHDKDNKDINTHEDLNDNYSRKMNSSTSETVVPNLDGSVDDDRLDGSDQIEQGNIHSIAHDGGHSLVRHSTSSLRMNGLEEGIISGQKKADSNGIIEPKSKNSKKLTIRTDNTINHNNLIATTQSNGNTIISNYNNSTNNDGYNIQGPPSSNDEKYIPSMILSQSTGVERRFENPPSITNSLNKNFNNLDDTRSIVKEISNKDNNKLDTDSNTNRNMQNQNITISENNKFKTISKQDNFKTQQRGQVNQNSSNYISKNDLNKTTLSEKAGNVDLSRQTNNISTRESLFAGPNKLDKAADQSIKKKEDSILQKEHNRSSLISTGNSAQKSTSFNNFTQFLKEDLENDGDSRTQKKLWLQRESSILDLTAQNNDSTSLFTATNIEVKREFERISHEYTNIRRFDNPLKEGISRLTANEKIYLGKSNTDVKSQGFRSNLFSGFNNQTKRTDDFFNNSELAQLNRILSSIWKEETINFQSQSNPLEKGSIPNQGQHMAQHNRTSMRGILGQNSGMHNQRSINSIQPTTRAVNRRIENQFSSKHTTNL
ncbi:hypothetical protein TBLA_0A01860 [Henningerozyma blattae CBS 6284]|uniref:Uncharacterized protein n=1 Tax=Henningerozyma blattae (strain ATCC 34711 / CBS 6284 / DSM 70876 / NBRC 10599 / NRRL Y-10934 / UCD 77-7) TaxID=1071380 RepID=I2GV35_HENB6|nr:hypothetical protein TBLA_0A01860 [Tetrapisispora blattae CBS 6284]CCH57987.1 hypothetical protein TBLA_0A01860 [Tetrapisispora blattae CBS 6284]